MAAMNEGAAEGNGHIVGVIHEMWLVDSSDWGVTLRDGGSHDVFRSAAAAGRSESRRGGLRGDGPKRELLVAGGEDLQERKRLLVDKADGLIVLPGGPGTWDELWEMACAVNIGLTVLPIVCVNVNGFYDPFRTMLERAWSDKLTKKRPHEIVHFEETAEGAIRWLEQACAGDKKAAEPTIKKRTMRALRKSSFLHFPVLSVSSDDPSWFLSSGVRRSLSVASDWVSDKHNALSDWWSNPKNMVWATSLVFVAGLIAGVALTEGRQRMALR
jgi:predicted Rossmann-fold nucleotide-binding protein